MNNEKIGLSREAAPEGVVRELHYDGDRYVGHTDKPIDNPEDRGMSRRTMIGLGAAAAGSLVAAAVGTRAIPGLKPSPSETAATTEHDAAGIDFETEQEWTYTVQDGETVSSIIFSAYQDLDEKTIDDIVYNRVAVQRGDDPSEVDDNVDDVYPGNILHIDYPRPAASTPESEGDDEGE